MGFFYDELFEVTDKLADNFDTSDVKTIVNEFAKVYNVEDDQNTWFEKIKAIGENLGYTSDMKAYKASPDSYKGNVADVSSFLRLAVTGRLNSPDMYEVMHVMGSDRVISRLNKFASNI